MAQSAQKKQRSPAGGPGAAVRTGILPPKPLLRYGMIAPILLLLIATAYGVLEVHSSTDTWIGLAAGKQILESDVFPLHDTFSYTYHGQLWYNQNWLTHVMQYWIYENIAPDGVIYFTWAMCAAIFGLVLAACRMRSGSWLGSLIAASIVALGCRDFVSARPATTGFFCVAALWMIVCALEGQNGRRRWWPVVLILPLMLFWGNAHGSFVFAYGMLALYVAYTLAAHYLPAAARPWVLPSPFPIMAIVVAALPTAVANLPVGLLQQPLLNLLPEVNAIFNANDVVRRFLIIAGVAVYPVAVVLLRGGRPTAACTPAQAAGIAVAMAAAIVLTIAIGPFGIGNFIHPGKVAGSELFRTVSEWVPPFRKSSFPPDWRFWYILIGACILLVFAFCTWALLRVRSPQSGAPREGVAPIHVGLYDIAAIMIGLTMTLWARRFAPMFLIFAAPAVLTTVVLAMRGIDPALRAWSRVALMGLAAAAAVGVAWETTTKALDELGSPTHDIPGATLLQRVTRYDATPHPAIMFLANNEIRCNLLTEWTQGGPVMFFAPVAKVFMDGRSQQVYSEDHYRRYIMLFNVAGQAAPEQVRAFFHHVADDSGTNAVLLRRTPVLRPLWEAVEKSPEWSVVLFAPSWSLFFRVDSEPYARIRELAAEDRLWLPDMAEALVSRGNLLMSLTPPRVEEAMRSWMEAVKAEPRVGPLCYPLIARTARRLGRTEPIRVYFEAELRRINDPASAIDQGVRAQLAAALQRSMAILQVDDPPERP